MARPASRGLGAFQGGPVKPVMGFGADVKGGPGMSVMGRGAAGGPGATRSGARPGSALKRVPTAGGVRPGAAEPQAGSVGLLTDVKVENRPLTSGGLAGMAAGGGIGSGGRAQGPGRQLADINYYRGELRNKLADITREIDSMNAEIAKHTKDNANYGLYERKYDTVVREVRTLEGQLADFNLALDKHRTNTDLNDIKATFNALHARNDAERKQNDEIFMKCAQFEKQTKMADDEIARIQANADARMAAAGEDFRSEYTELQDEAADLQLRINAKEQRLAEVEQKMAHTQQALKSVRFQIHAKGVDLMQKRAELARRVAELDDETNTNLTPAQVKEKMLLKAKDANAQIAAAEKRLKALEEAIDSVHEAIKKREDDVLNLKSYAQKAKKWEALQLQEKHFDQLIASYPEQKQTELDNRTRLQDTIVALMRHSSKGLALAQNLPASGAGAAEKFGELKNELNFKESRLKNAKETRDALEAERERRKNELHRVEVLDKKIHLELQALKEKVSAMSAEMNSFKSNDVLAKEADDAKRALTVLKQKLLKQREAIKQQVAQLSGANKKRDVELTSSDVYRKIQSLEKTLTTYSQTNFQMSEFIGQRKRESEYETLQKESLALTTDINALLISGLAGKS